MAKYGQDSPTARKFDLDAVARVGDGVDVAGNSLVDVGACLSKINHRLYRQGRCYEAKVTAGNSPTLNLQPSQVLTVYALAPTWWVYGMWRQAKRAYDKALALEKAQLSKPMLARWRDFRVESGMTNGLTGTVGVAGENPILYNGVLAGAGFTSGEFNLSKVENLDNGNDMTFTFSPSTSSAYKFSMPYEYGLTRNLTDTPETPITTMPYNELNANAESADYEELQTNGNAPPYNGDSFPQHIWVRVGTLQTQPSGTSTTTSTGYFPAPCGLICIKNNQGTEVRCEVEVRKGLYHGVHAPSMG